ncbi:MAG: 4Fe-4S dicluster domain-containing protein [Acidobacteria bacterium]|nr:4Fe-4S dicluster domain-containing protein [Acidobacteriota bacterium]
MRIDSNKCVACGNCTYVCPMGAIYIDPSMGRATINRDECVECYACFNGLSKEHLNPAMVRGLRGLLKLVRIRFDPEPDVCPTSAFVPDDLAWPRVVRRAFSDPTVPHESTGVKGRGTEEVKTNDVTGRCQLGEVNFTIEFGRPGVGARFWEVQKMTQALARAGVAFEKKNPVTALMSDIATGTLPDDVLNEKVLSCIVEVKVSIDRAEEIIRLVRDVERQVDTVIALGTGTRCEADGDERRVAEILHRLGYNPQRAKTNTGLGRVSNPEAVARMKEPVGV